MLTLTQIERAAENAAKVAYSVLGLDCKYDVDIISDPSIPEDGLLDTQTNTIILNLAKLKPFSPDEAGAKDVRTEEDRLLDESFRHLMKICYVVFHEMRHLYQKRVVEAYTINKKFGGRLVPQPESDKKCELWLAEMKNPAPNQDIEEDANDFAYYLSNRYPIELPMLRTSRRLGVMKRKYNKVGIPKD